MTQFQFHVLWTIIQPPIIKYLTVSHLYYQKCTFVNMNKVSCELVLFAVLLMISVGAGCRPTNIYDPVCGINGTERRTYQSPMHFTCSGWLHPGKIDLIFFCLSTNIIRILTEWNMKICHKGVCDDAGKTPCIQSESDH